MGETMRGEARLVDLGLVLPPLPAPAGLYLPAAGAPLSDAGSLMFTSGQTGTRDGRPLYPGWLGHDVTVAQGQEAARVAALLCLAELHQALGSLDRVKRIVKVHGWVASAPAFVDQPEVLNGASRLLLDVFGEAGQHARAAIGVAALPGGACVEVEVTAWVR